MTDSHKGETKRENVADSWEEAGEEAKEGIIGLYHQLLEYCLYKAYDFDVVHARACDRAARLKEENTFLRQKMWEEGWQFKGYHIIDPFGRCYPYVWGAEDEPVPDDPFFYDKETVAFFNKRQREIKAQKQRAEEILRAREVAQQSANEKPPFQILKRPQGCEKQPSSSQQDSERLEEKTRSMSLQEREAAYLQARERIFGNYKPEDEPNSVPDPNVQLVTGAAGCIPTGVLPPHSSYHVPRPRVPLILRTSRPVFPQPPPLCQGLPPYGMPPPPPPGAYTPTVPPVPHQRFPVATGVQHPNSQQQLPYFDSRIPPPTALPYIGQNPGQSPLGIPTSYNDPARNNPVPYGRPPTQLLSQNQFAPAFSDQANRFY